MEFLTLVLIIITCLLSAALAAAMFGHRPMTFEQALAAETDPLGDRTRAGGSGDDSKKKKTKKQQKKSPAGGSKKSGVEEDDGDDSMTDEDVAVGLLHARGISLKTTEITTSSSCSSSRSPRAGLKSQTKTKPEESRSATGKICCNKFFFDSHILVLWSHQPAADDEVVNVT